MIIYVCPVTKAMSAGVRILHRHVQILTGCGIDAAIGYGQRGYVAADVPSVPTVYSADYKAHAQDIFVFPEGNWVDMDAARSWPQRRIVIVLNWDYIYLDMPDGQDWRTFGIERVITHSRQIADFVSWTMRLPTHVFTWGIDPRLYFDEPASKLPQVVFMLRKQGALPRLLRALWSRNPDFVSRIRWMGLEGLAETQYAEHVRRARVYLNLSQAEGLPCSLLEAMRAGTIVAGYNSVGGRDNLIGEGPGQNCILAENLDYPSLATKLEPLLQDILAGDLSRWDNLRQNAFATAAPFTLEAEGESVIQIWRQILGR